MLALAAMHDLEIKQINVVIAFLKTPLQEEVWMDQLYGFVKKEGYTCCLKKALYGLKLAPRE